MVLFYLKPLIIFNLYIKFTIIKIINIYWNFKFLFVFIVNILAKAKTKEYFNSTFIIFIFLSVEFSI